MNKKKFPIAPKQNAARRLKIVRGHLDKVIAMVENDDYCIDILQQSAAIRSAIKKAEEILLINHMNSCVVSAFKNGGNKKTIEELSLVFKKLD